MEKDRQGGTHMDVRAIKHQALMQEWSARIRECRSSGKSVTEWCEENRIKTKTYYYWEKRFISQVVEQKHLPDGTQEKTGLIQVQPDQLPCAPEPSSRSIVVRCGMAAIELPAGTSVETISTLVAALNRHA